MCVKFEGPLGLVCDCCPRRELVFVGKSIPRDDGSELVQVEARCANAPSCPFVWGPELHCDRSMD